MKIETRFKNFRLSPADEKLLLRRIQRLEKKLVRFDPDLAHLSVNVERQARNGELVSEIRLIVMGRVLPAGRNRAAQMRTLLVRAFTDLERELDRFKAALRGERQRRPAPA